MCIHAPYLAYGTVCAWVIAHARVSCPGVGECNGRGRSRTILLSSPTSKSFNISLASSLWPTSSKASVASWPPTSRRTSSPPLHTADLAQSAFLNSRWVRMRRDGRRGEGGGRGRADVFPTSVPGGVVEWLGRRWGRPTDAHPRNSWHCRLFRGRRRRGPVHTHQKESPESAEFVMSPRSHFRPSWALQRSQCSPIDCVLVALSVAFSLSAVIDGLPEKGGGRGGERKGGFTFLLLCSDTSE